MISTPSGKTTLRLAPPFWLPVILLGLGLAVSEWWVALPFLVYVVGMALFAWLFYRMSCRYSEQVDVTFRWGPVRKQWHFTRKERS